MAVVQIYEEHRKAIDDILKTVKANQADLSEQKKRNNNEIAEQEEQIAYYEEMREDSLKSFWKVAKFYFIQAIKSLFKRDSQVNLDELREASLPGNRYVTAVENLPKVIEEHKKSMDEDEKITKQLEDAGRLREMFESIVANGSNKK